MIQTTLNVRANVPTSAELCRAPGFRKVEVKYLYYELVTDIVREMKYLPLGTRFLL